MKIELLKNIQGTAYFKYLFLLKQSQKNSNFNIDQKYTKSNPHNLDLYYPSFFQ